MRIYLFLLISCLLMTFKSQAQDTRLALVIGNSKYTGISTLPNPINDAKRMEAALKQCGFEVMPLLENATKKQMRDAINQFVTKLKNYDTGLVFYAGHGINVKGINFFVPIDYTMQAGLTADLLEANASEDCLSLDWLQKTMLTAGAENKNYIIISDACRNNPFRSLHRDIVSDTWVKPEKVPSGFVTCFSAAQGQKAADESAYMKSLLKYIHTPGLSIYDLFARVRIELKNLGEQEPEEMNKLNSTFYFVKGKEDNTDSDKDGILDKDDRCPKDPGIASLEGCPDYDNDGVPDWNDLCGNVPGHKSNRGCPIQVDDDPDGDGVRGSYDKCPNEKGVASNNGCPERTAPETSNSITESTNGLDIKMLKIPKGTFTMGSPTGETDRSSDEKEHRVTLSRDFYMSETEITQKQWYLVMGTKPSWNTNCDNCPVEQVSWDDAQEFIKKLNALSKRQYSLPTEAQWEYAARGGSGTNIYAGSNTLDDVAWYDGNYTKGTQVGSQKTTHAVKTKKANGYGLYDMSGNVWEWCEDAYDATDTYKDGVTDPKCTVGGHRVGRGGSWLNRAQLCRGATRDSGTPAHRDYDLGFRVVFFQ